jgi:hypothetical protein
MRRWIVEAAVPVVLCLAALPGGRASAQSIFGINFLGEHQFCGSGRYRALGFSSYAALDSVCAVSANPATMADLPRMTFSVVEAVGFSNVQSGDTTAYVNRFQLPSVMIGVPLRKGLVLGVGYRTRFEGRGDFSREHPIEGSPTANEVYVHRLSLFTVPLSIAWKAATWARVAGVLQLERGSIRDNSRLEFNATNFQTVESKRERSFSATSWGASALVQVHPRLSLGAGLNGSISYDVGETFTYTRAKLDSTAAWRFTLPFSWEIGAAFGINDRYWLTSHFWQRGAPAPHGFPQLAGSVGDERLISFGIERRTSAAGGFFAKAPLRLGFYEDRWHLEYPAGHPVHSRFVTFGSGFSLPGGPGAIDVSFEFGQIGSTAGNGIAERVFRIGFGVSASEEWSTRKNER